jgi:hypothetical protein
MPTDEAPERPTLAALRAARRKYDRHEARAKEIRDELDAAIANALKDDEVKVTEVDGLSPFSPRYTLEIARKNGIPPRKRRAAE